MGNSEVDGPIPLKALRPQLALRGDGEMQKAVPVVARIAERHSRPARVGPNQAALADTGRRKGAMAMVRSTRSFGSNAEAAAA